GELRSDAMLDHRLEDRVALGVFHADDRIGEPGRNIEHLSPGLGLLENHRMDHTRHLRVVEAHHHPARTETFNALRTAEALMAGVEIGPIQTLQTVDPPLEVPGQGRIGMNAIDESGPAAAARRKLNASQDSAAIDLVGIDLIAVPRLPGAQ